ncbi:MAG TPA: hypothetical protein GXZ79_05040 [Acholeplasma sp.]|nr:hypothetical protein [Acholeplasma sp.]
MMSPNVQFIVCVETDKKAATDSKYISGILKEYFDLGENKLTYVFLGGKFKYNHPTIVKEINTNIKEYQVTNKGQSFIIFISDKDINTADPRDNQYVDDITNYCKDNGYEIVWFVKTIEDVIWGTTISNSDKVKKSVQFIRNKQIKHVSKKNLSAGNNVNSRPKSNILTVFNKYPQIKKQK